MFGLGGADSTVSMIDANGVAFAAIQGLYEASQEKNNTIAHLLQEIASLLQENSELEKRLDTLEAAFAETGSRTQP